MQRGISDKLTDTKEPQSRRTGNLLSKLAIWGINCGNPVLSFNCRTRASHNIQPTCKVIAWNDGGPSCRAYLSPNIRNTYLAMEMCRVRVDLALRTRSESLKLHEWFKVMVALAERAVILSWSSFKISSYFAGIFYLSETVGSRITEIDYLEGSTVFRRHYYHK